MHPDLKRGKEFADLNSRRRDILRILHRVTEATARELNEMLSRFRGEEQRISTTRSNIRALSQQGFVNEGVVDETEYNSPKLYELSGSGLMAMREYGRLSKMAMEGDD